MSQGVLDADQLAILVVDDDPAMVSLIAEAMLREEHLVVTASSAEQGLEQLPWYTFHVAFIDHRLPEMDGLVLAEYLHAHNPDMQVALVTGDDEPRLRDSVQARGLTFIQKPFELAQLYAVVDAYRLRREEQRRAEHAREDPHFAPPIEEWAADLTAVYDLPSVPQRIAEALSKRIKEALNNLRSTRFNERDRVIALAGLLTARVLGIDLPKAREGETLYDAYDALMRLHFRRTEFGGGRPGG